MANEMLLPNIAGAFLQGRQIVDQRREAEQINQLRALQLQQGQNQLARDSDFRNALGTYLQGGSNSLAQMYAADPERAMQAQQFQTQRNALLREEQTRKAREDYASAQYVLQSKAPKVLAETQFPKVVEQLKASGFDWESATDDQVRQIAEQVAARSGTQAGIIPERVSPDVAARIEADAAAREDQQRFDADQKRLDRGADLVKAQAGAGAKGFENATTLRKEYDAQSKDFQAATQGYQNVLAASQDGTGASDIALIFSFMRTLDPASTVREGEFATAQNAGGIPDRVRAQYNKALEGELLTANMRADFVKQAGKLYQGQKELDDKRRKKYSTLAERNGISAADVIGEQVRVEVPPNALSTGQSTQLGGFKVTRKK